MGKASDGWLLNATECYCIGPSGARTCSGSRRLKLTGCDKDKHQRDEEEGDHLNDQVHSCTSISEIAHGKGTRSY